MSENLKTLSLAATWMDVVPVIERALIHGDENGQRIARQELGRMAEQADRYVEAQRAAETPVEQNPDVFIDRWHTEDAQSECDWLTDEQARQVMAKYLDRDYSDDFQIIRTIAQEMFPEESEAHHAAN